MCSVAEYSGMGWNRVVPQKHSGVRFWDGTESTRSSEANIRCRCGTHPSGRIGRTRWNGLSHALIISPSRLSLPIPLLPASLSHQSPLLPDPTATLLLPLTPFFSSVLSRRSMRRRCW